MRKIQPGTVMIIRFLFSLIFAALACTGCNLIYKQNIQQGNAIEQDDLDELYIGMNQRQVLFVLGTPSVRDPFHHERWDYVQTFSRRGSDMVQRTVTLRFEDGLLSEIEGQDDSFGGGSSKVTGDATEVASFVKSPDAEPDAGPDDSSAQAGGDADEVASFVKKPDAASGGSGVQSPQDAAMQTAEEEVLEGVDPDIEAINERTSEDREYQKDMELLDQTPDDDLSVPDIDG
jgi:outer membrane protein assembly factor BamE